MGGLPAGVGEPGESQPHWKESKWVRGLGEKASGKGQSPALQKQSCLPNLLGRRFGCHPQTFPCRAGATPGFLGQLPGAGLAHTQGRCSGQGSIQREGGSWCLLDRTSFCPSL